MQSRADVVIHVRFVALIYHMDMRKMNVNHGPGPRHGSTSCCDGFGFIQLCSVILYCAAPSLLLKILLSLVKTTECSGNMLISHLHSI